MLARQQKINTTLKPDHTVNSFVSFRRYLISMAIFPLLLCLRLRHDVLPGTIRPLLLSIALMLVYIWFRFELPFAIGAIIALMHDVILTLGMFALFGLEFNLAIVAAILLIVGYSMNDTVVVYDRVRENLRKYKKMPLIELLNVSVNDTLSRTVMTSLTTLLALTALLIFGGEVIRDFTIAMIWGVVVGTYSSVFVASAILMYVRPGTGTNEPLWATQFSVEVWGTGSL